MSINLNVAFILTGNSTDGIAYKEIVIDLIKRAYDAGLFVRNVTSDMGSPNQAMWRAFGIGVTRDFHKHISITHPCIPGAQLYFLPDVPHVIKNLKSALCKHNFHYKGKIFSIQSVKHVVKHDQERDLKLAPKLKLADIDSGHFDKMKVSGATHVFSNSVSSAILYLLENTTCIPSNESVSSRDTAWFIQQINHWFDLMSSRHVGLALSKLHVAKYDKEIAFLKGIVELFNGLTIGNNSTWKPVQTGVVLSTLAMIALCEDLLGDLDFIMTSRFTQDCLENLFSSIRLRTAQPSPIEFRNSLKIITVAQFLKTPKNTSYENSDSDYLVNYLEKLPQAEHQQLNEEVVVTSLCKDLDCSDLASLYYLAGWSLKVIDSSCESCSNACLSPQPLSCLAEEAKLTVLKEYSTNALRHPTAVVYKMLKLVETVFVQWKPALTEVKNGKEFMKTKLLPVVESFNLPTCHNAKLSILDKYLNLRIHIACRSLSAEFVRQGGGHLGSKSMTMKKLAKSIK